MLHHVLFVFAETGGVETENYRYLLLWKLAFEEFCQWLAGWWAITVVKIVVINSCFIKYFEATLHLLLIAVERYVQLLVEGNNLVILLPCLEVNNIQVANLHYETLPQCFELVILQSWFSGMVESQVKYMLVKRYHTCTLLFFF